MELLREYPEALILAVVAHVSLALGLVLGVDVGSAPPTSPTPGDQPVQAVAVNEKDVQAAVKELKAKQTADEEAATQHQKVLQHKVEELRKQKQQQAQALEQQKKQQAEQLAQLKKEKQQQAEQLQQLQQKKQQSQQQAQATQQQLDKLQKQREQLQKQQDQLKKQQQQLAEQRAQEKKDLEKLKQQRREAEASEAAAREEAQRARQQAKEAQQKADEAKAKAQAQKEAEQEAKQAAAEKAKQKHLANLLGQYKQAIRQRVQRYWRPPANYSKGQTAEVQVTQIPSGDVTDVKILSCSGSSAFCDSVVSAVQHASPLPPAPDPEVFQRVIQFAFRPESSS